MDLKSKIKYFLFGAIALGGLIFSLQTFAETFKINPLFETISTDSKTGLPLVNYTQEQKDMTILYGKLDGLSNQIQNLSQLLEATFKVCQK